MVQHEPQWIQRPCPLCGSEQSELFYRGTLEPHGLVGHDTDTYACTSSDLAQYTDIVRCLDCDVLYLPVRPSADLLERLYQDVIDVTYLSEEEGRYKTFSVALKDLETHTGTPGTMLEIGSYTGVFAELATKSEWRIEGVEPSAWARDIAHTRRGLNFHPSLADAAKFSDGAFDCVVMWDVIEHLADPRVALKESYRLLKPGGILALSTITIDSISAKILRRRYPFLMQMHLLYFTRRTLTKLLQEHGFEVQEYKRHRRYVSYSYLFGKFRISAWLNDIPFLNSFLRRTYFVSSVGLRDVYARKV